MSIDRAPVSAAGRPRREAGLSLIEVMIALALLSVALIALIGKIHDCIDMARVTEYQNASREYSKELMAEIEAGTIDGLFDGFIGDFSDRGYPQLRYSIRIGDSSTAGTIPDPNQRNLYDKPARTDGTVPPATTGTTSTDPTNADATDAEEPYTRVQITVDFPTVSEDVRGTYTLEKKLPTPNTKGSKGLQEQKERDAEKAASGAGPTDAGAPAKGGNAKGSGSVNAGGGPSKP